MILLHSLCPLANTCGYGGNRLASLCRGMVVRYVFGERSSPLSRGTVWVLIQKYAKAAGLSDLNIHPHMLRHACGYDLANRGGDTRGIQGFLGHSNIQHTVRYTALSPNLFA